MWTGSEDAYKRVVQLPLKTWWLFLSSVWRPPHSFFRSCSVSCSNSPATSLTERLPEEEGGGRRKGWKMRAKNRETKEQEEVCRCYIHQYINTLLQACTEIIFIHHYWVRKKRPIQLIGLSRCQQLSFFERGRATTAAWHRLRENVPGAKGWSMLYAEHFTGREGEKKHLSHCLSVLVRAEVCSIKAAPTSCQSIQHAFHRCISHRPLESVSHCRHSPTGTIILDTKEQKNKKGERGKLKYTESYATSLANSEPLNYALLCAHSTPSLGSVSWDFQYFWLCPFSPQKRIQSGLTFGLYKWQSSSSSYWRGTYHSISNAPLCLFITTFDLNLQTF